MDRQQDVAEVVEMVYRPTREDVEQAMRAQARVLLSARLPWYVLGALVLVAGVVAWALTSDDPGLVVATVIGAVVVLPLGVVRYRSVRRAQAAAVFRFAEADGECHTRIDAAGVAIAGARTRSVFGWDLYPRYVETAGLFVLLSGDRQGAGLALLPKRGIQGPDGPGRLRGLLDRHAVRVG